MKRSFGSKSSNNSNSSSSNLKSKKKKATSNQKTLGVVWGAASLSSSRSSFRSSPFSDFGSYMSEKNRKLHNQFDAEASMSSSGVSASEKLFFHGVSIFVDGFTIPSSQELRDYMLKYGGRFENYFSRRTVTHIICSNLPDSKIKNLRSFSRGLPVVKPTWILDSVSANRLLSWVPYQLDQLMDAQPKLSAFFAPKSHSVPDVVLADMTCQPTGRFCDARVSETEDANSFRASESGEERGQDDDETDCVYREITTPERIGPAVSGDSRSSEVNSEELDHCDVEENEVKNNSLPSYAENPSASTSILQENDNDGIPTATAAGPSKRRHSTLEDPNFVENYFKSSRLHFIGTWRNRYRKRFHSSSNGIKSADSGHNTIGSTKKTAFIHIDLDCFFVSVVIKNRPELQDKPVAVCHSDNLKGTAEISSANYPARAYGVKAGMFVRNAKDLCPHLVILPYNFEAYEEVADQFYDILHKHCSKVQAVSCDEAFLDVSDFNDVDPEILASTIRNEIFETTGCSASAGIASTMLMARLATRTAKPAGQFHIPSEKVDEYLEQLPVDALPGVGYVLREKLKKHNIRDCSQLRLISKDNLQKDFGMKTGEMLWSYSRGLDHRSIRTVQENKSIGAEVNWGVRFRNQQDIQHFLQCLCKEVSLRLQGCEMLGRTFTLKIKKRRKGAAEPAKYMGCGDCDNLSRSITVPVAIDDMEVLQRIANKLFGSFYLDIEEIRGVGLQVSKLENAGASKSGSRKTLKSWLSSASTKTEQDNGSTAKVGGSSDLERHVTADASRLGESDRAESSIQTTDTHLISEDQASSVPPLCHLDMEVLEGLPPEVLTELDQIYGGKLVELIEKRRGKRQMRSNSPHMSFDDVKSAIPSKMCGLGTSEEEEYEEPHPGPSNVDISNEATIEMADLMPLSFSQVDTSVLQELPEDLRADLLGALPAHRKHLSPSDIPLETKQHKEPVDVGETENENRFSDIWIGNPPLWVRKFKDSNHHILRKISEVYYKLLPHSRPKLSSILQQHVLLEISSPHDSNVNDLDEALYNVCELLRQYIKLKIEGDIEEIYLCFRIVKRLAARCQFFLQVYEIVFPFLQVTIGEYYGGNLNIC